MFGWLKRRIHREHRMLSYQNFQAATYPEMTFLCIMKEGFDPSPTFTEVRNSATNMISKLAKNEKLLPEEIDRALHLNKELRRIYHTAGRPGRGSFDQIYRPLGGWSGYFERNSNETYLVEQQAQIETEINLERGSNQLR